jgi:hypothetical protein
MTHVPAGIGSSYAAVPVKFLGYPPWILLGRSLLVIKATALPVASGRN